MTSKLFKISTIAAGAAALALAFSAPANAGPDENQLSIEGQAFVTDLEASADSPLDHIYSGWRFRSQETQAFQADDFENPAFPAVEQGADLWKTVDGTKGKSCASCHNDAETSMKGVRASYPKMAEGDAKPWTMENRINNCREKNMGAEKWKYDSGQMLALNSYVGLQSRGMPVKVATDGPIAEWHAKGKDLYYSRVGQLNMSCANCHENNYGNMIRADHLSQGQINGFPVYRLKWAGLGSAHRRFKGCMKNIRAKPFKVGSDEFIALEAYLASRGNGLSVETPSVRN